MAWGDGATSDARRPRNKQQALNGSEYALRLAGVAERGFSPCFLGRGHGGGVFDLTSVCDQRAVYCPCGSRPEHGTSGAVRCGVALGKKVHNERNRFGEVRCCPRKLAVRFSPVAFPVTRRNPNRAKSEIANARL